MHQPPHHPSRPTESERRRQRSDKAIEALHLQLEATLRRARLEALALVDSSGLLVAGVGDAERCEELGASAPLLAGGQPEPATSDCLVGAQVSIRAFECLGERLFLAGAGAGAHADEQALIGSADGVRRILLSS